MADDLRAQVQHALSGTYTLERELGGGGMSRVFVAEEHKLGRKVVVKVLSPHLPAPLSTGRLARARPVPAPRTVSGRPVGSRRGPPPQG